METAAPSDATASEQLCGAGRGGQRACPGGGRTERKVFGFFLPLPSPFFRPRNDTPGVNRKHTMQVHASGVFGVATQFFLGSY
mgnify:CR=1 FL=1